MPLHQQRLHQGQNPERNRHLNQDAENHSCQERLFALCAQIQQVREKAQKHSSALFTCIFSKGRRYRRDWSMQAPLQDSQF